MIRMKLLEEIECPNYVMNHLSWKYSVFKIKNQKKIELCPYLLVDLVVLLFLAGVNKTIC